MLVTSVECKILSFGRLEVYLPFIDFFFFTNSTLLRLALVKIALSIVQCTECVWNSVTTFCVYFNSTKLIFETQFHADMLLSINSDFLKARPLICVWYVVVVMKWLIFRQHSFNDFTISHPDTWYYSECFRAAYLIALLLYI